MSRAMAGIDVGKGELDVSVDGERARRFANTAGGVGELLDWLQPRGEVLAVCEATGGYERLVVAGLREGGVAVPVAHPNRVRADARAGGYAAKTDGLDAVVLSRYGEAFQPPATLAQDADRIRLQDLLRRREQLVGQRTQEKNRLARVHNPASQDSIRRHIAWLDEEIGLLG
ncbi:Pilin gene-inverting protein [Geodia barretti]|uniref:Pilin gene-inverting protein n=1 Tax=Geodia barretti TaxID=519541 RepID=A0AA35WGQ3_GEOBA|nr:Pilin gene-inverting protein [Geodia barretti]